MNDKNIIPVNKDKGEYLINYNKIELSQYVFDISSCMKLLFVKYCYQLIKQVYIVRN